MRLALVMGEVASGLRRNLSMVVSVVLVTFISLTFVGAAVLLQSQITQMKGFWYDRAQVAIYFCSQVDATDTCSNAAATPEQIAAVEAQLDAPTVAPYVASYEFEDRAAAYQHFMEQFEGSTAAGLATEDTMNEALWVSPTSPDDADLIAEATAGMPGVLEVRDQRALLDPIFAILNAASVTAVGIAALMLVAAVLLISTTIRLSAVARRRELGIMRLVGASNRFIQTPFILEGVIAALIGSLLAAGVVVGIVAVFIQGYLRDLVRTTALVTVEDALLVSPILIVIGVVVAAIAAAVAIRRYLKI